MTIQMTDNRVTGIDNQPMMTYTVSTPSMLRSTIANRCCSSTAGANSAASPGTYDTPGIGCTYSVVCAQPTLVADAAKELCRGWSEGVQW